MKPAYPSATFSGTATASNNQSQTANFKIEIVNQIDGAQYDTQMTADGVRVIATKVFNENIDKGVASVLGKRERNRTKRSPPSTTRGINTNGDKRRRIRTRRFDVWW